ncbi:MAG: Ig-like domain-containing protein, partial [Ignavibacteriales bacterium]|nr:Ig-like domain-containing protein [Ignavibacteriales bacterium]
MNKRISTYIAFVLTALCSTAVAQIDTLHLSLPDSFGKRGTTYAYPVFSLDSLTTLDSIYSGEFTIQQNGPVVVDVLNVDTVGTILSGVSSVYFNSVNKKIVFAHTQPITGNGVLFYLLVQFRADASGTKSVTLINNLLNEGQPWDPKVVVDPGSFRPMDIFINPKNPPQDRVVGDTIVFSVTGDVTLPVTWGVSDTAVATIDSTGLLIGKNVGQTTVSVTDAQGLTDQSAVLPVHPPSLRSLTVTAPDTSIMQNLVFDLPIRVSDVSSLGIISAQFSLDFNQSILKPLAVINAGTLTQTWSLPVVNYGNGTIQVALAGADTLTGSGTLVYVRFKVARFASFGTFLNLSGVLFNENLNATIDNGFFSPLPGPAITIQNFPFGIIQNETVQLFANGGTAPYRWFIGTDTSVATIDSVSGLLKTKTSGFMKVTAIDANGFDKSDSTYVGDARITFPDTSFVYSDSIDVPVTVSDLTGLSVLSGEMKFMYDSTKLRLARVEKAGTMISSMLLEWRDSSGIVSTAFSGSTALSGSGVLLKLRFTSAGPGAVGFNQLLMANQVYFNEQGPAFRVVAQKAGKIVVLTKPNTPPVFTNKLRDTTITENQSFTFQLQATDAEGDSLIFGLFNVPPGMAFNPKSGLINWTPGFTQAGTYKINYDVGDYQFNGVTKDSAVITVLDGNRQPIFSRFMKDTMINEDQLLSFDIDATDPDGDIVRYYIGNIQPGMNIDTVTGMFSWKPAFTQAGTYNITQIINDGKGGFANQPFVLTVKDVDRLPLFTKSLPDTSILAGQTIQYIYQAVDPDGTPVNFSLNDFPPGATITQAGLFSWTPQQNQSGTFRIVVAAGNAASIVRDTAFITVSQTNQLPVFVNVFVDTTIAENQTLTFTYQASDPDNDTLVWAFQSTPPSGMTISAGGLLTWTPSFTQAGSYQIIVKVSDKSFSVTDTALITVTNTNLPPNFTTVLPDTTIYADSLFLFSYKGIDPDGDSVSFALLKFPAGAIITAKGILSWIPTQVKSDTFIVSISDGSLTAVDTAIVTVTGFPKLQTAIFELDFGTTIFGSLPKKAITIKNIGVVPLILNRVQGLPGENNFTTDTPSQVTVNVQEEKILSFTYTPENIGAHIGGMAFQTNDPKQQILGILLKGISISKSTLKKKILVDVAHNSTIPLRDSIGGMTQLFSALKSSGFAISFAETTLAPTGFDAVVIAAPQKDFSSTERTALHQFISNGGLVVMMGNERVDSTSNSVLNGLLQDTSWVTGLSMGNNLVTDSTNNYFQNPQFPIISQFADTAHPYVRSIDTVVFFGASSVIATGNGIPFARFMNPSVAVGGGSTEAAIGFSEIGKGKLLVFGDATTWLNGFSAQGSFNIDAQDNLAFALNIFSVTEDYEVKLPSATPNERYQLVSIP